MDIDTLIDEVIAREGGFVDNPLDRGGPTNWGITEQVARAYGYDGDMRKMPRETAAAIYRARYWTGVRFDLVAQCYPKIGAELLDAGVNHGPARAGQWLQRALNVLNRGATFYPDLVVDGAIGPMTLHALLLYRQRRGSDEGQDVLLSFVIGLRQAFYVSLGEADHSQETFEYGWGSRMVARLKALFGGAAA